MDIDDLSRSVSSRLSVYLAAPCCYIWLLRPDANSNDVLSLRIDDLRKVATQALASINLVPA